MKPSLVIEHAVTSGWLTISDDGLRVRPGDVYPSLEDASMRYAPQVTVGAMTAGVPACGALSPDSGSTADC